MRMTRVHRVLLVLWLRCLSQDHVPIEARLQAGRVWIILEFQNVFHVARDHQRTEDGKFGFVLLLIRKETLADREFGYIFECLYPLVLESSRDPIVGSEAFQFLDFNMLKESLSPVLISLLLRFQICIV